MSDWVRVATFEAGSDAVDAIVNEISSAEGPPPGIPAKSILILADRDNDRLRIVTRFDSEENLRTGSESADRRRHAPHLGRGVRGRPGAPGLVHQPSSGRR
jgi:antibiotic biosynthesis monooxygenase (ABM) superfamily enzyme